jgi:primosomal replication protein N
VNSDDCNLTQISGKLIDRDNLRRTPAGIPVLEFSLAHASKQIEAEIERTVECEVDCVAIGNPAQVLAKANPGDALKLSGFLAPRSIKQRRLKLHVTTVDFLEGTENGI